MHRPNRILLQTTIAATENDWHIGRFSLLRGHLYSLRDADGDPLFDITASDRDPTGAPDSIPSRLDQSSFDHPWLFAVDVGDGLDRADCAVITRFRRRGGELLVARGHMDLGSSVRTLGGAGAAHFFHSKNPAPDPSRCCIDDTVTIDISSPNYHSGANGDSQHIEVMPSTHPMLSDPGSPTGAIRSTHRRFNLAMAFEPSGQWGRPSPNRPSTTSPTTTGIPRRARRVSSATPPARPCRNSAGAWRSIHLYMRRHLAGRRHGRPDATPPARRPSSIRPAPRRSRLMNLKPMHSDSPTPRWIEWSNLSLGIVLAISPWLAPDSNTTIIWNALISGSLIACIAANSLEESDSIGERANIALGLWLMLAPGLLAFSNQNGPTWICVLIGFAVTGLSGHQLSILKRLSATAPQHAGRATSPPRHNE